MSAQGTGQLKITGSDEKHSEEVARDCRSTGARLWRPNRRMESTKLPMIAGALLFRVASDDLAEGWRGR